jgi:hypothetical protein
MHHPPDHPSPSLVHDTDAQVLIVLSTQLLQSDRCGQSSGSTTNNEDIKWHGFSRFFVVHESGEGPTSGSPQYVVTVTRGAKRTGTTQQQHPHPHHVCVYVCVYVRAVAGDNVHKRRSGKRIS